MITLPSLHASATLLLTVGMFIAFARGRTRPEITSLVVLALMALGLALFPLPGREAADGLKMAFSGFGHTALVTICCLMIMGRGLVVTGALEPVSRLLQRVWRWNQQVALLVTLLLAMTLSMGINDTPVLLLFLPILTELATRGGMPASKTLIPVNAAVLIGGMATTIGTSTNLLVVSIASDLGMPPMTVFQFTPIVLLAAAVALPFLWLVMPRLLPDNSVAAGTPPRRFQSLLRLTPESALLGRDLADARTVWPDGLSVRSAFTKPLTLEDRLHVEASAAALAEAMHSTASVAAPPWLYRAIHSQAQERAKDIMTCEMVVSGDSELIGRTLEQAGLANERIAVLGVHHARRPWRSGAGERPTVDTPIAEGDVLLVYGAEDTVQDFARRYALMTLDGQIMVPRRSKALLAAAIMVSAVGTATLGLLPIVVTALAGATMMFITGCVKFENVGRALSASVIVLVGASIALGQLVLDSGAAQWLGDLLAAGLQHAPPALVIAAVMGFVTVLTNFASNATAAAVGTPIGFTLAQNLGIPPEPLVLAVLFGCNLCYATPVAYQTNMIIMSEGGYRFSDYIKTGLPLVFIMIASLSAALVWRYGL